MAILGHPALAIRRLPSAGAVDWLSSLIAHLHHPMFDGVHPCGDCKRGQGALESWLEMSEG